MDPAALEPFGHMIDSFKAQLSAVNEAFEEVRTNPEEEPGLAGSWNIGYRAPDDWQDEQKLLDRLQRLATFREMAQDAHKIGTELLDTLPSAPADEDEQAWADGRAYIRQSVDKLALALYNTRRRITAVQEAAWRVRRNNLGLGEAWVGGWAPGSGSFGMATAWYKRDDQDTIIDRVVIKETTDEDYGTGNVNKNLAWSKDPRDATGETFLPNELAAMYSLSNRPGSDSVVQIRNSRLVQEDRSVRIYMEYCPYGDLERFTGWYYKDSKRCSTEADWEEFHEGRDDVEFTQLPEPFLWSVFESLAQSGLLMEQAADPIYHLDYKTQNVLLGIESKDRYRGYPMAKLTDFGLSWIPDHDLEIHPNHQKFGAGTCFNSAPEQIPVRYDGEDEPRLIDGKTNVWGVGIVMWSLIEHEEGDHRLRWETRNTQLAGEEPGRAFPQDCDPNPIDTPDFRASAYEKYSQSLLELIMRAAAYEQEDRPTSQELLNTIRRHTGSQPGVVNRANGMRWKRADASEWSEGPESVWRFLPKDEYALFAKLSELPVPPKLDADGWRMPPFRPDLVKDTDDDDPVGGGPWRGLQRGGV